METDRRVEAKFAVVSDSGIMVRVDEGPRLILGISKELFREIASLQLAIGDRVVVKYDHGKQMLKEINRLISCELAFVGILQGEPKQVEFLAADRKVWILDVSEGILGRIEKLKEGQKVGLDIIIDSPNVLVGEIFNLRDQ